MALCAVYTMHMEMRSVDFLFETQNQGRRFVSGLTSKLVVMVFSGLTSKPVVMVSHGLTSEPVVVGFLLCASKPAAMIRWFEP
jgi:hypothetical protein